MPVGSLASLGSGAVNAGKTVESHPTKKRTPGRTKVSAGTPNLSHQLYTAWPISGPGSAPAWQWSPGNGQPVAQGYDANVGTPNAARKSAAVNEASGYLVSANNNFQMSLLVTSTSMDTELAGTTAQSKFIQDFYPKNFVQPSITVSGWSLDQEDYGLLCEFVRYCQLQSLNAAGTSTMGWISAMTQLVVLGKTSVVPGKNFAGTIRSLPNGTDGPNTKYGPETSARAVTATYGKGQSSYNQSIKGAHETTIAKGYISSMPRIHEQFQYAVQWEFDFVIAAMLHGLYRDNRASVQIPGTKGDGTWMNMLADAQAVGLSTVTAAQNTASLAYAAQHSATYLGSSPAGGSANADNTNGSGGSGAGGWLVIASAEDDPPGAQGACRIIQTDGYSELSTVPMGTASDFAALGNIPCLTPMKITNPKNGNQVTTVKQDKGAGSSFLPVMGLYPGTRAALGLDDSGEYHVLIQRADGKPLHPVRGTFQAPSNGGSGGGASTNGTPTASMVKLYNYALNNNSGNSGGHCLEYMQQRYLAATGAPGHQIPLLNYAWDFAVWCQGGTTTNGTSGTSAAQAGLKILSSTNPYDAPQGCIVVVPYPSPGTFAHTGVPNYDGDISVASGSGQFINDGPNEQYGGSASAWNAAGHQAVLLVPTSFGS